MEQLQEVMLQWSEIFLCVAGVLSGFWWWTNHEKPIWRGLSVPIVLLLAAFGYDVLMNWRF